VAGFLNFLLVGFFKNLYFIFELLNTSSFTVAYSFLHLHTSIAGALFFLYQYYYHYSSFLFFLIFLLPVDVILFHLYPSLLLFGTERQIAFFPCNFIQAEIPLQLHYAYGRLYIFFSHFFIFNIRNIILFNNCLPFLFFIRCFFFPAIKLFSIKPACKLRYSLHKQIWEVKYWCQSLYIIVLYSSFTTSSRS